MTKQDKQKYNVEKVLNVYLPKSSYDKNGKLKIRKGFEIDDKHLEKPMFNLRIYLYKLLYRVLMKGEK